MWFAPRKRLQRVVKRQRGAVDVVADPIRGKPYIEIRFDRERAARLGVSVGAANEVIEAALAGRQVTTVLDGRERHPVVVRYARDFRDDENAIRNLLVTAQTGRERNRQEPRSGRSHSARSPTSWSPRGRRRSRERTACSAITSG